MSPLFRDGIECLFFKWAVEWKLTYVLVNIETLVKVVGLAQNIFVELQADDILFEQFRYHDSDIAVFASRKRARALSQHFTRHGRVGRR